VEAVAEDVAAAVGFLHSRGLVPVDLKPRNVVRVTLRGPLGALRYDSRLIGDLGAESLDFLDIAFRLERAFDIRIPRGGIEAASKEGLAEGESYEVNGVLTPAALERLAAHMPEVPRDEFRPGLKVSEVSSLMRVGTFCNVVAGLRAAKA
jgi:hypothetical protein